MARRRALPIERPADGQLKPLERCVRYRYTSFRSPTFQHDHRQDSVGDRIDDAVAPDPNPKDVVESRHLSAPGRSGIASEGSDGSYDADLIGPRQSANLSFAVDVTSTLYVAIEPEIAEFAKWARRLPP